MRRELVILVMLLGILSGVQLAIAAGAGTYSGVYYDANSQFCDNASTNCLTPDGATIDTTIKKLGSAGFNVTVASSASNTTLVTSNFSTVQMWFNFQGSGTDDSVLSLGSGSDFLIWLDGSGNFEVNDGGEKLQIAYPGTGWKHLVISWNNSASEMWLNNVLVDTGLGITVTGPALYLGTNSFGNTANVRIDELFLSHNQFRAEEVNESYNGGAGFTDFLATPSALSIDSTYPDDNGQFNTELLQVLANVTYTGSTFYNVSLFVNGTLNQTQSNFTTNANVTFNLSFASNTVAAYSYYINATDGTDQAASPTKTFFIDNVVPTITLRTPSSNQSKRTFYYNFTADIEVADDNLYAWYVNLTRANGAFIYNWSNTSLTGLTGANISLFINMTDLYGVFNLSVTVTDGHTKSYIEPFDTRVESKELFFDAVRVYDLNKLTTSNLWETKFSDRHKFGFEYLISRRSSSYVVESDEYIDILDGRTGYKAHLVTGGKWIDFENEHVQSVSVLRLSPYRVQVNLEFDMAMKQVQFDSIGELNIVTQNVPFFMMNASTEFEAQAAIGVFTPHSLNTTFDGNYSDVITAVLTYNGTEYSPTVRSRNDSYNFNVSLIPPASNSTTESYLFKWNFTVDGRYYSTPVQTQSILSNVTVFINFFNEITRVNIPEKINVSFITDNGPNYVFQKPAGSNAYFNATLLIPYNYTMRYVSETYGRQRQYIFSATNLTIGNFSAYLLAVNDSSDLRVTVYDSLTINTQPEHVVYLQRYRVNDSTYETVAMYTTDESGNAYFDVESQNELYQFRVDKPWLSIKTITEPNYIESTTLNIFVDNQQNIAEDFFAGETIINSVEYLSASNSFRATFEDNQGVSNQICLDIYTYGQFARELVNNSCTTAKSGSIQLGGLGSNTTTYYAVLSADINPTIIINQGFHGPTTGLGIGIAGLFYTVIILCMFVFLVPNHISAALFAGIALIISKIWGVFEIDWAPIMLGVAVLLIVGMFLNSKR